MLFRQIRLVTGDRSDFNKYIIFVDCKGAKNYEAELESIIKDGFYIKNQHFVISERSASMVRTSILSFIDDTIESKMNEIVSMGLDIKKTVLSKWYAYRGLMLSSCHCIENWFPKIVVVPDYYRNIPNQRIKYVYDKKIEITKDDGTVIPWVQKDIAQTEKDIEINVFDGCGIHHPKITQFVMEKLNSPTSPTTILWRMPFIKGVTHEMNYVQFFKERGITTITDVWGEEYDVTEYSEPMIIVCESMYKGLKYFKHYGDIRDWQNYWEKFKKYNHCVGIAKWNFSLSEEPIYTRGNYQILQDLELNYDDFELLSKDSVEWIEKIINGDTLYTYCFLGMTAEKHKPLNNYTKAILKNPEMLKEQTVRNYLISLVEKYKDEMKCGKLWLKACFKFLAPDLIMLMEHIGGIENPKGCLEQDEFFTFNIEGDFNGEYLIERNPHICRSEHTILKAQNNDLTKKYCSHLANVAMINGKSITPQRLNGADFDGDLVLVIDNGLMMQGVDRTVPIVMDIDDKVTVLSEEDNLDNKINVIKRGMTSLIGETSNCATTYHNKKPKTNEQRDVYRSYVDLLSVINGKVIDSAKTGVIFKIPRHIAKYTKPLPYFMKYASPYYRNMSKFLKSNSNMNRLCWKMEKWDKTFRWKRNFKDFNYNVMIDNTIPINEEHFKAVEGVFKDFCKEINELTQEQNKLRNYDRYKEEFKGFITKEQAKDFVFNWQYYYDKYKSQCLKICPNIQELANIAVILCYEKYPNKNKKFLWRIAGEGIVKNIAQIDVKLPYLDLEGTYTYLGKKYNLKEIKAEEMNI